jgi:3-oxoacyl-[acyl-carrier-protein] synthase-3
MIDEIGRAMHFDAGVRISGVGSEIPPTVVTTAEVEERVGIARFGLEPGWLQRVTGVRERRWAEPETQPSDLAAAAARRALEVAQISVDEIDLVIFAGITRDFIEPATSNAVAAKLGAVGARVFDVTNACNGLIDGLDVADSLIRSGKAGRVLVTTGERASISIAWNARSMEELLRSVGGLVVGDGGGAVVLERSADPHRGLRGRAYRSSPQHWELAVGGRFRPTTQACEICGSVVDLRFLCDGRRLFEVGFALMPEVMQAAMTDTGWDYDELDVVLCHEASKRFVENGMTMLGEADNPGPKIWSTVERFGNTSTVSLPLQMSAALEAGALVPGAKVLALGGSSGVSMAAVTIVW